MPGLSPDIPRDVSSPTSHPEQSIQEARSYAGSYLKHLQTQINTWTVTEFWLHMERFQPGRIGQYW